MKTEVDLMLMQKTYKLLLFANERVLIRCFQQYKESGIYTSFDAFQNALIASNWEILFDKYPAIKSKIKNQRKNLLQIFSQIRTNFEKNKTNLIADNIISNENYNLIDIEIGIGDFHNGSSTAILNLENGQKIVFKPTSGRITKAFHSLIDWIGLYYSLEDCKYKIRKQKDYHWLEFKSYKNCRTIQEVESYYNRAGYLLSIVYLLNGCDYHCENIIANGDSPVLIDHETIIQPKISENFRDLFKSYGEGNTESVLNCFLIPNKNFQGSLPMGMCGFGLRSQTQFHGYEKVGVNRLTDNWKMVTRMVIKNLFKNNIPILDKNKVYPSDFLFSKSSIIRFLLSKR